ncbi:hypothetical protein [uncultured Legionella sp.]|nr:hypothetical protein [uncultured Legionella sp.]
MRKPQNLDEVQGAIKSHAIARLRSWMEIISASTRPEQHLE